MFARKHAHRLIQLAVLNLRLIGARCPQLIVRTLFRFDKLSSVGDVHKELLAEVEVAYQPRLNDTTING